MELLALAVRLAALSCGILIGRLRCDVGTRYGAGSREAELMGQMEARLMTQLAEAGAEGRRARGLVDDLVGERCERASERVLPVRYTLCTYRCMAYSCTGWRISQGGGVVWCGVVCTMVRGPHMGGVPYVR
jgi:hypothetical protein